MAANPNMLRDMVALSSIRAATLPVHLTEVTIVVPPPTETPARCKGFVSIALQAVQDLHTWPVQNLSGAVDASRQQPVRRNAATKRFYGMERFFLGPTDATAILI